VHIVPSIGLLIQGASIIYDILVSKAPDYEAVDDYLMFLSEAMSNMGALIEVKSESCELEDLRDILRNSMNRIRKVTTS